MLPSKWSGTRRASSFGNICPQMSGKDVIGKEDCLFLNVYTPITDLSLLSVSIS